MGNPDLNPGFVYLKSVLEERCPKAPPTNRKNPERARYRNGRTDIHVLMEMLGKLAEPTTKVVLREFGHKAIYAKDRSIDKKRGVLEIIGLNPERTHLAPALEHDPDYYMGFIFEERIPQTEQPAPCTEQDKKIEEEERRAMIQSMTGKGRGAHEVAEDTMDPDDLLDVHLLVVKSYLRFKQPWINFGPGVALKMGRVDGAPIYGVIPDPESNKLLRPRYRVGATNLGKVMPMRTANTVLERLQDQIPDPMPETYSSGLVRVFS